MRVTSSMYYHNLFGANNSKLSNKLFDVNKQIASGLKIQYAYDNVTTFTKTMSLDNEVTTLGQVKKSTESGYKFSNQSDVVLGQFETTMSKMKTLLLQAANGDNDNVSQDAIAKELRGEEKNLKSLANSSINGKYLFSGSIADVKPIDSNGKYHGNGKSLEAVLGSNNKQEYNLSGKDLFLGNETQIKREITSNNNNINLLQNYPKLQASEDDKKPLSSSSTIRNLMGDTDAKVDDTNKKHYFYLRGTRSDGTAFKEKFSMKDTQKVSELLKQIGNAYGNTIDSDIVNVSLDPSGGIVVQDKQKNSSKLDFHMVGAIDFSGGNAANVDKIDELDSGETDFDKIINGTSTAANSDLFVKEFNISDLKPSSGSSVKNIDGLIYDRANFTKDGSTLSSDASQVTRKDNQFAIASTKLSEVADLSQGSTGTLDGTTLKLVGKNINGDDYDVSVNLKSTNNNGSTFTNNISGNSYTIYNMDSPRTATDADKVTYQQLMDITNMSVTNNFPTLDSSDEYDKAIVNANKSGNVDLSYDGKINFSDKTSNDTSATISMYDSNSGDFTKDASVMTFNTNDSLTIRDPKTDFFKTIDEVISSIEEHKNYPDTKNGNSHTIGIENAIKKIDDLQSHVQRMHSKVGAQSNTLTTSLERTQLLKVSTMTLRSSVIDTDVAESALKLQQLNLNYQAMLSTVGKVSKLSLVNYL